ncbi:MAG: T9SS type A sorting domain-containing protein [Bacteroidota bacterium]
MKHSPVLTKSMLIYGMLFLFTIMGLWAQETPSLQLSHALNEPTLQHQPATVNATGVLDIVAIMVEFQPDTNRLTSGTGIFGEGGLPYLERQEDTRIDPLPHNQAYFETKLEFAKRYYERVSDNQLTVNYTVLPRVYRLDNPMEAYSPIGETFTNEPVAQLAQDAWQKVEEAGGFNTSGLDPDRTAFIIFHAGIGRDVELTGTSLDITPFDIPSLSLSRQGLTQLLRDPGFQGFPINGGAFRVTNSLILPRTQSRRGEDIQENEVVFPLSTNGLICASIGSFLGLPDLFDTQTGAPAIGRFGLMDGAGFFAYNGLFPPEPSAWEKLFLGWITPTTISPDSAQNFELGLDELIKIDISSTEYFLIENRHRDPALDGVSITIRRKDGTEILQTFTNSDEDFIFQEADFDTLFEAGTIIEVSDYDWALPGGLDIGEDDEEGTEDDRELNGGILIWHIDEAQIMAQLPDQRVNADPNRRGVDLEEADGAQDIGPGIVGALDNSAAFGSAFDYWWSGNNFRVISQEGTVQFYENRFGPDTRPNTNSNSGSINNFELYDFSDNQIRATFSIRPVQPAQDQLAALERSFRIVSSSDIVSPQSAPSLLHPSSLSYFEAREDTFLLIPSTPFSFAWRMNLNQTGIFSFATPGGFQPLLTENGFITGYQQGNNTRLEHQTWNSTTDQFGRLWDTDGTQPRGFLSSNVAGTFQADFSREIRSIADGSIVEQLTLPEFRSSTLSGSSVVINALSAQFSHTTPVDDFIPEQTDQRFYAAPLTIGSKTLFFVFEDERFLIIDPESRTPVTEIFSQTEAEWPAFGNDGSIFWIDREQNQLSGFNPIGGLLSDFPFYPPEGVSFIGTPLIADLDNDEQVDFMILGQDSLNLNLYGYNLNGNELTGFPLLIGATLDEALKPIHPIIARGKVFTVAQTGEIRIWDLPQLGEVVWGTKYGTSFFEDNKLKVQLEGGDSNGGPSFSILNTDETYNWPNPADEITNIRYELQEPGGEVEIKIIALSGRLVYETTLQSGGGFPEEHLVTTRNWGSGSYVAVVKATVNGRSESKLIKIGVVH